MGRQRKLSREVAIVGAGMSPFGLFPERETKDLVREAFDEMRASVDKGLDCSRIDAFYFGNFTNDFFVGQSHWGAILSESLSLVTRPATRTEGACASSALAFREAVFAVASGFYDVVLVGGFEEMSKRTTEEVAEGLALAASPYERSAGLTFPGVFGTLATAYFDRYNASREHLMHVTIKSHDNAQFNPKAQHRKTIQQIMESKVERAVSKGQPRPAWQSEQEFLGDSRANPPIAWPMHLFDCSPISDGAACVLVAGADVATDFTDTPIRVRGIGQGSGRGLHSAAELTSLEATKAAAYEAYQMAGVGADDIQFAEVHDCFSIAEILHMEDLGFCKPGTACHAVEEGMSRRDGAKPINTSGGLKCKGHPVGATGVAQLIEVWHQLRRSAGQRQIPNENLVLGAAQSLGGTGGTCAVTVLERRQ